jgi:IclR family KDG regulon transcriptional repressor
MSDSGLLFKAFTLLHLLKPRGGYTEWGAAELSRQAGYNPGTTHRILQDMLKTGFVHQNPKTKKFHLGSAFIEFVKYLGL